MEITSFYFLCFFAALLALYYLVPKRAVDPAACGQPCLLLVRRQRLAAADSVSGCGRSGDLYLDGGDGTGGKSRKAGLSDRGGARRRSVPHRCACAAQVSEFRHASGGWHDPGAGCCRSASITPSRWPATRCGCLQWHRGAAEEIRQNCCCSGCFFRRWSRGRFRRTARRARSCSNRTGWTTGR